METTRHRVEWTRREREVLDLIAQGRTNGEKRGRLRAPTRQANREVPSGRADHDRLVAYHGAVNEQIRKYWPVYLLVLVGAVLVLLASVFIGTSAVPWIGAIVGVAVGMAIAAITRRQER